MRRDWGSTAEVEYVVKNQKQNSYNALMYGICELVRLGKGRETEFNNRGCDYLIDLCPNDQGRLDGGGGMEEPGDGRSGLDDLQGLTLSCLVSG
jgi:hypothetical protein